MEVTSGDDQSPAVDPYMEVTAPEDRSPIGMPLMVLGSHVQQQVLAIYHLFLCLDYPPTKADRTAADDRRITLTAPLEADDPRAHGRFPWASGGERPHVFGARLCERPLAHSAECHAIERLLESQEYNTPPAGLPAPKPLERLDCRGQKKRPAAAEPELVATPSGHR